MRSGQELCVGWNNVFSDPMLSMDRLKERGIAGDIGDDDLRSLYWKIFLEYLPSLSKDAWPLILSKERQGYTDLKTKFMFDPNKAAEQANDWSLNNPLSLADESPWTQYFKDVDLQKVIRQDVERTFPDQPIFRTQQIQDIMTAILFIWCKLNPDVSYRQGMHELLAPILLVVDHDKLDPQNDTSALDPVLVTTFDAKYVEHDAAVLFYRLMRATKPWFEVGPDLGPSRPSRVIQKSNYAEHRRGQEDAGKQVPIVAFCRRVQHDLLRVLDFDLYQHLEKQGIEPQLYGIRWLRLLFGREFPIPELFVLWDGIFADDPNLGLVEWLCIALLLYLRKDLVGQEYAITMHRLMKFPSPDKLTTTVSEFIRSARGLRDRYNHHALFLSSNSSRPNSTPSSPTRAQYAEPNIRPPSKKRTTVPWSNHTANPIPEKPVRSPSASQFSGSVTTSYPPMRKGSYTETVPASPTQVPSSPGADGKQQQLQLQLAHLTRQVQQFRERDREFARKISRWIDTVSDVLDDETDARLGTRAEQLRGIVDEMQVIANELHPGRPESARRAPKEDKDTAQREAGDDEKHMPSPIQESTPSVEQAKAEGPAAVHVEQATVPTTGTPDLSGPAQSAVEDSVDNETTGVNPSRAPPSNLQNIRWGSSTDIRNAPAKPLTSHAAPPEPLNKQQSQSSIQGYTSAPSPIPSPSRVAASTDPWASETTDMIVGTVKAGVTGINKVLMGLFEDPWADHGVLAGRGGGAGRRRGSSRDIREGRELGPVNYPSNVEDKVDNEEEGGNVVKEASSVGTASGGRPTTAPKAASTLDATRVQSPARDPLGAGFARGTAGSTTVTRRRTESAEVDPLGLP
ncbi:uncharacterized protein SPPG_00128 [Spizellomyces punctatus DAOM BR117]|uniref:Rab-GAP TBC domain-containing protein n=1 Tax=Spizellomyces punctatus (strain DAOM BR117) TaxID=645134 RepID=A0A0L0HTG7_SPIPD|nr:uncharacterized protein SPPG_00128 [Spizellomyces punctatus DAOM BR117]KND04397.1 hypothetical protein SPPG_00128 [Spizellomyces punctatus DAOM BR117]|eukprot:XP_016612436.1 hypothetical protein SPPG_00128 [Spizellomyces punctatus DAOM BR117]